MKCSSRPPLPWPRRNCRFVGPAADNPKRKILFFTKSGGFEHSSIRRNGDKPSHADKVLMDLGKQHNFEVVCTKDGGIFDKDIGEFDAFFFQTQGDICSGGRRQAAAGVASRQEAVARRGGGRQGLYRLALRRRHLPFARPRQGGQRQTQTEVDPYIAMVGGEFISHGPQQVVADGDQPMPSSPAWPAYTTKDSADIFKINDEWYSLKNYANDLHVILVQDTQGMKGKDYERAPFPATWARKHGKGRVFYTSMGHSEEVWSDPRIPADRAGRNRLGLRRRRGRITPNIKQVTPRRRRDAAVVDAKARECWRGMRSVDGVPTRGDRALVGCAYSHLRRFRHCCRQKTLVPGRHPTNSPLEPTRKNRHG